MFNNLPKHSEATHFKTDDSKHKFLMACPRVYLPAGRIDDDILHNIGKALENMKVGPLNGGISNRFIEDLKLIYKLKDILKI